MTPPPVIVRAPANLGEVELLVCHGEFGVTVDVRPAFTRQSWQPLKSWGGTFEVRDAERGAA